MLLIVGFFLIQGFALYLLRQVLVSIDYFYLEQISVFLLTVNSILFAVVCWKKSKNRYEFLLLFSAYLIRVSALLWDILGRDIFVLPSSGIDTEVFQQYAVYFANGVELNRGGVYFRIVGLIYRLFGVQRITAQYFNVVLSMFSIFLVKNILASLVLSEKIRMLALAMMAFLPYYVIMSSILLRESVIIFLITVSLYFFIKWWQSGALFSFVIAIVCPLVAALFHSGSMAPTVAYALIFLFYLPKQRRYKFSLKTVSVALAFLAIFFLVDTFLGVGMFRQFDRINSVDDIVDVTVRGGAGYLRWMDAVGTAGLILFSPIRMFYFIASPLPWYWRGFHDIFGFLGSSLFYVASYYFLFRQLRNKNYANHKLVLALLVIALFSSFMFAWGVNNAGTALRHRDKFISIFIVSFAVGWDGFVIKK